MPEELNPDQPRRGRELPAEYYEFRRRADALVERRRQEYEASLRSPAPASPETAPLRRRLGRWFTLPHLSYAFNVLVVCSALVGWTFRAYLFPEDRIPVRISGHVVTVWNPAGTDVIWSHDFGFTVRQAEIAPWGRYRRYIVVAAGDSRLTQQSLTVWDFRNRDRDAEPVWAPTVDAGELDDYYPDYMREGARLWCNAFAFPDIDGDGEAELAACFHEQVYLPSCIRTMNRKGEVLGTYFHWGFFRGVAAVDIDGDGRDEILGYGTNNAPAYQGATVVLLDEHHLSGYAVDAETHPAGGFREGALARLVMPIWNAELAGFLGVTRLDCAGLQWLRYEETPVLQVKVGKGFVSPWEAAQGVQREEQYVIVTLDPELRPVDVLPHDNIALPAHDAFEKGLLSVDASSGSFWRDWLRTSRRFGALTEPPPVTK